jgi:dimethylargininase
VIEPARARRQHDRFRELLGAVGVEVVVLPPDEQHPDACFTQDLATVLAGRALLCRPRLLSRRDEVAGVLPALSDLVASVASPPPEATLEGGDVLQVGHRRLVVGRSSRTNDAGVAAVVDFARRLGWAAGEAVVPPGILHLQTGVTAAGPLLIGLRDLLDQEVFTGLDRVVVPDGDLGACNVLSVGRHVITAGRHIPHRALERAGLSVHELDLSEFVRADGGPTCLALMVP